MSTAEPETENKPQKEKPTEQPKPAEKPKPAKAPEPAPAPKTKPDVYRCSFQANGTHDKGTTDVKATSCDVDFDKTQILIIVHDGKQYHFNRTKINEI